jgi:hypothetical protein
MFTRRGETELVVKGRYAVNINLRYIEKPGHLDHGIRRKISQLFLDFLQNGYKTLSFTSHAF